MNKSIHPAGDPRWLKRMEWLLASAVFIALAVLLAKFAGGPVKSDEVMYIHNGLLNVKDTFILNRYTHIYFQKLFMALAPDPFSGVKAYWGFLVAGSAALTYLIARLVTRSGSIVHSIIAALLYLSIPILAANSGNTAVDITAGFFLALTLLVYLLYFRGGSRSPWLLGLFGLLFFLSVRSKETTLALVVLFAGFLFNAQGKVEWRLFFKRLGFILLGVLAGVLLFMLLNGIFLKDAWFGLRLKEYFKFKSTYVDTNIAEESKTIANWFTDYLFNGMLYIFLAYILSGVRVVHKQDLPLRLPWLVPLAFVFILSAIIGFSKWGVVERHIFPALPLICAFAPQLIRHPKIETRKDLLKFVLVGAAALVLLAAGRYLFMKASTMGPYNYPEYLASSIYPITLLVLIGMVFFFKEYSFKTLLIPLLIFGIFLRYPLSLNTDTYFKLQPNVHKMDERLQIFRAFDDQFRSSPADKVLVFDGAMWRLNQSSRLAEFIGLYNMLYDGRLTTANVKETNVLGGDPQYIDQEKPDLVLMTVAEYDAEGLPGLVKAALDRDYKRYQNNGKLLYLFVRK